MEDHRTYEQIPYIVHESAMSRNERSIKRLIFALVFSIFLIFISNAIWLYAWMQYDYESSTTQTIDVNGKEGNANYINGGGSIVNGKDNGKNSKEKTAD